MEIRKYGEGEAFVKSLLLREELNETERFLHCYYPTKNNKEWLFFESGENKRDGADTFKAELSESEKEDIKRAIIAYGFDDFVET